MPPELVKGEPGKVFEMMSGRELDPGSDPAERSVTPVPGDLVHLQLKIMVCYSRLFPYPTQMYPLKKTIETMCCCIERRSIEARRGGTNDMESGARLIALGLQLLMQLLPL